MRKQKEQNSEDSEEVVRRMGAVTAEDATNELQKGAAPAATWSSSMQWEAALGEGGDSERTLLAMAAVLLTVFMAVACCQKMIRSCFGSVVKQITLPVQSVTLPAAVTSRKMSEEGTQMTPSPRKKKPGKETKEAKPNKPSKQSESSLTPIRSHVEGLECLRSYELKKHLPVACSYDCGISKPLRSRHVLRLEGTIVEALGPRPLLGPLPSKSACCTRQQSRSACVDS